MKNEEIEYWKSLAESSDDKSLSLSWKQTSYSLAQLESDFSLAQFDFIPWLVKPQASFCVIELHASMFYQIFYSFCQHWVYQTSAKPRNTKAKG